MTGTTLLHPATRSPRSGVNLPGGRTLHLPDDLAGRFGVVLFSRGARCPYRNAQLSAFQRVLDGLAAVDASILELSVNDEATTRDLIARHGLRFPVGHSADATAIAETAGAFVDPDPLFLQSTGLVLDPRRRPGHRQRYSSGAPGRLVPKDVIGLIRYLRGHAPASQSDERQRTQRTSGRSCRLCPSP